MTKRIQTTLSKYFINQASSLELDELELWIENPVNEKEFNHYVKTNFAIDFTLKKFNSEKTLKELNKLIREEKRSRRLIYIQKYSKQTAIFIVTLFATIYVFNDSFFPTPLEIDNHSEAVITEDLLPGTDKAVLTLEDGSVVALEKGQSVQIQNANSNGEEIIYSANSSEVKKVVYNYLTIPRGGKFFIELSDGTQVWLNSETKLKYPVHFIDGVTRQVELIYGEAYFDVSPSSLHNGTTFKVLHPSQEIEVLGTAFNIKAYKDETNVYTTLIEGKVEVVSDKIKHYLLPNQQSNLNIKNKRIVVKEVDVFNEISWKEGVFTFESKPLKDIVKVLSRWYDKDFVFDKPSLENNKFNGSLNRNLKINEILDIIKNFEKIKAYEINKKSILIK